MNKILLKELPSAVGVAVSPGRVNLLGEHVDYNDGLVLPAAIDRYMRVAFAPRDDDVVHVRSLDLGQSAAFCLQALESKQDVSGSPLPAWALYPAGVAWSLQQAGFSPVGLDAVVTSTVPIGAGLSSSAALELAFAAAWQAAGGWKIDRMRLAQICQQAENTYVGVNCGLMDQFACAHGVARHALYLDTRSLTWQPIPLPLHTSIVIADSTIERELSVSAYNQRRDECQAALRIAREIYPMAQSLRDIPLNGLEKCSGIMPKTLFNRLRHVVEEMERVRLGCQLLFSDDAAGFGRLMAAGHDSLRDLYEVSIPALDTLVTIAQGLSGCFGARLTGAGFGGCTVNLVESAAVGDFVRQLQSAYQVQTGIEARVYICKPSRGVHIQPVQ
jgi:galactokinase